MHTIAMSTFVAIDDLCFRTNVEATNRLVLMSQKQLAQHAVYSGRNNIVVSIKFTYLYLNNTLEVVMGVGFLAQPAHLHRIERFRTSFRGVECSHLIEGFPL